MARIFHASLQGLRQEKDLALYAADIDNTEWLNINIETSNFYLLTPQNSDLRHEYEQFWDINKVMKTNVTGFQTHRDHFAIDFNRDKLLNRIQEMFDRDTFDRDYTEKYLLKDNRDWNLSKARQALRSDNEWQNKLIDCLYRPFDKRSCYFSTVAMDYPRRELINHVADKDNLCLGLGRQGNAVNDPEWALVSVSSIPADANVFRRGGIKLFPLYIYPTNKGQVSMGITREPNICITFLDKIKQNIGYTPTPEAVLYYIYAILHSPSYRMRYAEFLKIDFPRIPVTRNIDLFHQLGELGEELVSLHLMKSPILNKISSPFINNGGGCIVDVGHPEYESGKVVINKQKDCFMDVPEAVWNFHVGGYKVCHQWLEDRKGRTLSQDDIGHYQKIVVALGQSIDLMAKIDAAIPNWPMDSEYN
jgi:predicted helicase